MTEFLELPELRPRKVRNKLGFLLYSRESLYHLEPVLKLFDAADVDLVLYRPAACPDLEARVRQLPYHWCWAEELLEDLSGYRWLVSNYSYGYQELKLTLQDGRKGIYTGNLLRLLGVYNFRFLYGLGVDRWNRADWNQLYDAFLCLGPLQAQQLRSFRGAVLEMGYPRYDALFRESFDRPAQLKALGCDPARPVLVWLPTLRDYYGSLELFAEAVSALSRDYNLLLKPHPASWIWEQDSLSKLNDSGYTRILRESIDNLLLYRLADFVICDYGGTAFSALYTDCNLLLLDHPDYQPHAADDQDLWLRRFIVHLKLSEAEQLSAYLADRAYWSWQKQLRQKLRHKLFTPNYGHSAETAAWQLRMLMQTFKITESY